MYLTNTEVNNIQKNYKNLVLAVSLLANNAYLQLPEKFIGCVMASYRSILSATSTYVEEYVTTA
jgi:hypothetical protein